MTKPFHTFLSPLPTPNETPKSIPSVGLAIPSAGGEGARLEPRGKPTTSSGSFFSRRWLRTCLMTALRLPTQCCSRFGHMSKCVRDRSARRSARWHKASNLSRAVPRLLLNRTYAGLSMSDSMRPTPLVVVPSGKTSGGHEPASVEIRGHLRYEFWRQRRHLTSLEAFLGRSSVRTRVVAVTVAFFPQED